MKKIIVTIGVVIGLTTGTCFAGHGAFYTDDGTGGNVYFLAKFSGNCPSGNVLQTIGQSGSNAVPPASAPPYLGPGETLSVSGQAAPTMGTDPLYWYYYGDGVFGTLCDVSDTHLHGYVRAFSWSTIPEAAYYGSSPCVAMNPKSSPVSDNMISANVTVGTVNPAYNFPGFSITTPDYSLSDTETSATVAGDVPTAVSDNNMLTASDVTIYWTNLTSGVAGNFVPGNGSWSSAGISVSGVATTNIVRFCAVGNSSTPDLPRSADDEVPLIVIPEPALLGILAIAALVSFRRK